VSGVENVEISVLDPTIAEVRGGVGFCMKQGGILGFTLALCSNQVSFFLSSVKANILGDL